MLVFNAGRAALLVCLLLLGCGEPARYERPKEGGSVPDVPARLAFWNGVAAAERDGMTEFYAYERFTVGDAGYEALGILRVGGRTLALYAESQAHDERPDSETVPCHKVSRPALRKLRRRIAAEIPPDREASWGEPTFDRALCVIHVFRAGHSYTTTSYLYPLAPGPYALQIENQAERAATLACYSAILAAAPPAMFALYREREDEDDPEGLYDPVRVYAKAPGYPGVESK